MNCQFCHKPIENLALHIHFNPTCRDYYLQFMENTNDVFAVPSELNYYRIRHPALVAFQPR